MGVFETLAKTGSNKVPVIESYSINRSFTCATLVDVGAVVRLKSDATVDVPSASGQDPLGIVVAPNKIAGGKVTVQTPFSAIVLGIATETLVPGYQVSCKGYDATAKLAKYDVVEINKYSVGLCLSGGIIGATVVIGIYRVPVWAGEAGSVAG